MHRGRRLPRALTGLALLALVAPLAPLTTIAPGAPSLAAPAAAQTEAGGDPQETGDDTTLALPAGFAFADAVLLSGRIAFDPAAMRNVTVVGAVGLVLPPGTLRACPALPATGAEDAVPTPEPAQDTGVPGGQGGCRDGQDFEDAEVAFGPATQVALDDRWEVARFPDAALSLLVVERETNASRARWGAVVASDGLDLRLLRPEAREQAEGAEGDGNVTWRFAPLGRTGSTEVRTRSEPGATFFNGTGWSFEFRPRVAGAQAEPLLGVRGTGLLADLDLAPTLEVRLEEASTETTRSVPDVRRLLDVQREALGADAREPLRNLTAALSGFRTSPWLMRGALLGRLEGEVGGIALPQAMGASAARVRSLHAGVGDGGTLRGDADVVFAVTPQGFALASAGEGAAGGVASPPWLLVLAVVGVAVLAHVRHPRPAVLARGAVALGVGLAVMGFLAWDLIVRGPLGTSGLALLADGEPIGAVAGLLAFQGVGFALGWLLLQVPLAAAAHRALYAWRPEVQGQAAAWGALAAAAVFLVYAWLDPASLLALGHTVARL